MNSGGLALITCSGAQGKGAAAVDISLCLLGSWTGSQVLLLYLLGAGSDLLFLHPLPPLD